MFCSKPLIDWISQQLGIFSELGVIWIAEKNDSTNHQWYTMHNSWESRTYISVQNSQKWCSKQNIFETKIYKCPFSQQACTAHNNFEWWTKSILRPRVDIWMLCIGLFWRGDFVSLEIALFLHFPFRKTLSFYHH